MIISKHKYGLMESDYFCELQLSALIFSYCSDVYLWPVGSLQQAS